MSTKKGGQKRSSDASTSGVAASSSASLSVSVSVPPTKRRSSTVSNRLADNKLCPVIDWAPPSVALSTRDKASQLLLSEDQLTCFGCEGGYRMIRATHGVHNGAYYWEAMILAPQSPDSHIRIGWSTRQGELQGPVGYDAFSFGYRDVNGACVLKSIRNDGYGEPYTVGDVVGCYINLDDEHTDSNEIRFFKNGKDQGVAFSGEDVPPGVYFPAVSLFMKATVTVNFGPSFIVKQDKLGANAVSEVQPMSPQDRKEHELRIQLLRESSQSLISNR